MTHVAVGEDFDCEQFTPDSAAIVTVLWGDADVAAVLIDAERTVLAVNPAATPLLSDPGVVVDGKITEGHERLWIEGEDEICPPSRRAMLRALNGETVRRQVVRLETVSIDEPIRLRVSSLPVRLHDGSRGAVMIWQDITERWLTQRRDRRDVKRLEQLLEGASDYAILMLGTDARVMTWSNSAERVHGYGHDEAIELPYHRFFTPEARADGAPERILEQARRTGSARTSGLRVRKDGSTFWAEGSVSALRDDAGDVCGFVKVTHDTTEQRRTQQEIAGLNAQLRSLNTELESRVAERTDQLTRQAADLTAANAELEAFSYSVSHDLRAPLRAMSGYARIMEESFGELLPPEALGYLHKVNESALNMGQLIDGLLALSRTQRMSLSMERLDMPALVRQCWDALAGEREGRAIHFTVDEDLPPADGDHRLISQVWANLLQNAITFTSGRDEARIHVGALDKDGVTTYQVEDNGVGFDMQYAAKIGQVFQRLHDREFPGTGIGMAIVQRIVARHGGSMSVYAEPDVGARMGFSLWVSA